MIRPTNKWSIKTMTYTERKNNERLASFKQATETFKGEYRKIPENPNYWAFSDGRIYSYNSRLFLKPANHVLGYHFAGKFTINGVNRLRLTHTVITHTFLGPCPLNHEVNHINGIKTDNRIENLEYVTRSENMNKAWQNGLMEKTRTSMKERKGERNGRAILSESEVREIIELKANKTKTKAIAKKYGMSLRAIYSIFSGRTWSHVTGFKKCA